MTADQNTVTIRIGGRIYGGWKSVTIDVGIEQAARGFACAVTEKFPGSEDFGVFRNGDLVQVYIGPDLVCTGYIDSTPISYTAQEIQVQIQGKSRTIDLVQCCPPSAAVAPPPAAEDTQWSNVKSISGSQAKKQQAPAKVATSWRGCTVGEIIAALAAPYGISVQVDASISGKLTNHTVNPGETVIESINRLVTKSNLWLTDDPQGNLVITQLGAAGNCTDGLVLGKNILSGGAKFDGSTLFSKYVVSGQHAGTDTDFGRTAAEDRGVAEDSGVQRFRLTVIKDKGQSSNKIGVDRATFEQKYARARYAAADYVVQGWRQRL